MKLQEIDNDNEDSKFSEDDLDDDEDYDDDEYYEDDDEFDDDYDDEEEDDLDDDYDEDEEDKVIFKIILVSIHGQILRFCVLFSIDYNKKDNGYIQIYILTLTYPWIYIYFMIIHSITLLTSNIFLVYHPLTFHFRLTFNFTLLFIHLFPTFD